MSTMTLKRAGWRAGAWMAAILLALLAPAAAWGAPGSFSYDGPKGTGAPSTNWTVPDGIHWITVELWGGGGGGGAATGDAATSASNPATGGGGAGGQYARKTFQVTPGGTHKIVAGGWGANGNSGKDSTFGGSLVVAKGGEGGRDSASGGTGGIGSTAGGVGDVVYPGGDGSSGSAAASGAGGGGPGGDAVHPSTAPVCSGASGGPGQPASGANGGALTCYCGGSGGAGSTANGQSHAVESVASQSGNPCVGSENADPQDVFGAGGGGAYRKNTSGTTNGGHGGRGRAYVFWDDTPITLTQTAGTSSALLGEIVPFVLHVKNNIEDTLKGLVVTDVLPAGMVYLDSQPSLGSVAVNGQTLTWTLDLPALADESLVLNVRVAGVGVLDNTARAPGAKDASASVRVVDKPNVHFRMDELADSWSGAAGEVIDSGGAALHGRRAGNAATVTNAVDPSPTIDSQHTTVQGSFCNAGHFDGSAYVEIPHDPRLRYTSKMSASVWFYVPAAEYPTSGAYAILSNDKNYELLLLEGSQVVQWWWDNGQGGGQSLRTSSRIPADKWTHVAITFDGEAGQQAIYVNGKREGNLSWRGTLQPNPCSFLIGADVESDGRCTLSQRNFHGMIDEVKLYDRVLSADEVQADMALGRQCSGVFDHVRIEHGGLASACSPETVTVKACLDATCSALYKGAVTVSLSPSGWEGGGIVSLSEGQASVRLNYGGSGEVTLGTANVVPAPGGETRCFANGVESCAMNFSGGSCAFDAVEPGANPPSNLFTKLAGRSFDLDLLSMKSPMEVNPDFTGDVLVDLVDASSEACPAGDGLIPASTVSYAAEDSGRKRVSLLCIRAARKARVRVRVGDGAPACSGDGFAIRPQGFVVTSSANADALGERPTVTSVVRAGASFRLIADSGTAGYDGIPRVDPASIEWDKAPVGGRPAPGVGTLDGATPGELRFGTAASVANGNGARGDFTYDEAGYFRFKLNGVHDDSFVDLSGDKAAGDCIAGGFSNTADGNGKYGCNFGNLEASGYFGRFIPDHFDTAVTQGCAAGGFTYSGQPFPLTVTAKNSGGGTTRNYSGIFVRNVALTTRDAADTSYDPGPGLLNSPYLPAESVSGGVGGISPAYTFSNKGTTPATVRIRASDDDNVSSLRAPAALSVEGLVAVRSGRVFLGNVYGSEQVDLAVPFRAEYFDGAGWRQNVDDSCIGDITLGGDNAVSVMLTLFPPDLATCVHDIGHPGLSNAGCAAPAEPGKRFIEGATPSQGFVGDFNLWLQAPGANRFGTVKIEALLPSWLGTAAATAAFGRKNSPLIFRRENY